MTLLLLIAISAFIIGYRLAKKRFMPSKPIPWAPIQLEWRVINVQNNDKYYLAETPLGSYTLTPSLRLSFNSQLLQYCGCLRLITAQQLAQTHFNSLLNKCHYANTNFSFSTNDGGPLDL